MSLNPIESPSYIPLKHHFSYISPWFSPWFSSWFWDVLGHTFRRNQSKRVGHLLGFAHTPQPRGVPGALDRGFRLTVEFLTRRATTRLWGWTWVFKMDFSLVYICIIYTYVCMYVCMHACMHVCFLKWGDPQVTRVVLILSHGHP